MIIERCQPTFNIHYARYFGEVTNPFNGKQSRHVEQRAVTSPSHGGREASQVAVGVVVVTEVGKTVLVFKIAVATETDNIKVYKR